MRSLPLLILAFAALGCTESTKVDNAAHTNVTGTWAVQWTGMTGVNTVKDTTIVGVDTTVTDSTVSDTCSGTATITLQQASPVAYVTGTYVLIRICRSNASQRDSLADTVRGGALTANNELYFALDKKLQQAQLGTVSGSAVPSGAAAWILPKFPTRPSKGSAGLTGTWTATKQ